MKMFLIYVYILLKFSGMYFFSGWFLISTKQFKESYKVCFISFWLLISIDGLFFFSNLKYYACSFLFLFLRPSSIVKKMVRLIYLLLNTFSCTLFSFRVVCRSTAKYFDYLTKSILKLS